MNKMKVLMIDYAAPRNLYSDGLNKVLYKFVDLTVFIDENAKNFIALYNIKPKLYNGGKQKLEAMVAYLLGLIRILCFTLLNKIDIVHIQTYKNPSIDIKLYRFLSRFVKIVHTAHNILPHESKSSDYKLYKKFYRTCHAIIVHNEYCKNLLIQDFGLSNSKITVIPRGIYDNNDNANWKMKTDIQTYIIFGKIRKYKGLDILLRAITLIPREKRITMKFIIAGEQDSKLDDTNYATTIKELDIEDVVELRRVRINQNEKEELFLSADACICPYKVIFGSGVLLEAYTYHCPVIVSDLPTFQEDTNNGKTGVLFETENEDSLARAIVEFSELPQDKINEFRTSIMELVKTKYNWEIAAMKTLKVYEDTIN